MELGFGLGPDFQNPKFSGKIFVSNCAPVFGILPRGEWGRGITDAGGRGMPWAYQPYPNPVLSARQKTPVIGQYKAVNQMKY